jgi:hypothetical protein
MRLSVFRRSETERRGREGGDKTAQEALDPGIEEEGKISRE